MYDLLLYPIANIDKYGLTNTRKIKVHPLTYSLI